MYPRWADRADISKVHTNMDICTSLVYLSDAFLVFLHTSEFVFPYFAWSSGLGNIKSASGFNFCYVFSFNSFNFSNGCFV